ncbi:MAG: isoamylase early set domain-containing protein [Armatimonadetes bacterium]|nr:isoamylase early set domain-containing protein [Armatimonadota bacterium]
MRVEFVFYPHHVPQAPRVSVAGDFNGWDVTAMPMMRAPDGSWRATIDLPPGEYQYKFYVDGTWWNDPHDHKRLPNPWGSENSVIIVQEEGP